MRRKVDNINGHSIREVFNSPARPIVGVDVEKYKAFLDDPALSEAEKENFLQALWSIVVTFVDLGFGVHPLQEVCDEDEVPAEALKEAFDSTERAESNGKNKRDDGPAAGLEME